MGQQQVESTTSTPKLPLLIFTHDNKQLSSSSTRIYCQLSPTHPVLSAAAATKVLSNAKARPVRGPVPIIFLSLPTFPPLVERQAGFSFPFIIFLFPTATATFHVWLNTFIPLQCNFSFSFYFFLSCHFLNYWFRPHRRLLVKISKLRRTKKIRKPRIRFRRKKNKKWTNKTTRKRKRRPEGQRKGEGERPGPGQRHKSTSNSAVQQMLLLLTQ